MLKTITLQIQRFLDFVDGLLDPITSYRLVLYFLYVLAGWGVLAAAFTHQLPFKWYDMALSILFLMAVCRAVNFLLSYALNIPRNSESDFISALILALIISPAQTANDYLILGLAGAFAMAAKYVLVINRRHIFNPAAAGAYLSGLLFHHYASWWVGTVILTPVVLAGGLLILRKMKRYIMVAVFIVVYLLIVTLKTPGGFDGEIIWHNSWVVVTASPLLFFSMIMLTEPLTSPSKFFDYAPYAVVVAVLYGVTQLHVSPEAALLIGNVFAFTINPYKRLGLSLTGKRREAEGIYTFSFAGQDDLKFQPGQYMEWTIPSSRSDSRGNRRYLTISSSPTEKELAFTVKVPSPASSFKTQLQKFQSGDRILATHLAGSFTLPKNQGQKLAFVAGGVGITPFRSIIKYLVDSNQHRDILLLYSAAQQADFAFTDLFTQAQKMNVKTVYSTGKMDVDIIAKAVPDLKDRLFYISGPYGFVKTVRQSLIEMGLPRNKIISDYFPGYG